MDMLLRLGSKGQDVKELQHALGIAVSGEFDKPTEKAVKAYQSKRGLMVDGLVGNQTMGAIRAENATTDLSEKVYSPIEGLFVHKNYLPPGEYIAEPTPKEYLFLHHTQGWNNPYDTIHGWATDDRGPVATEFVMGGRSIKDNDDRYDGELVQCIPEGAFGWHLGDTGSRHMNTHSVGIELCNFGATPGGKTAYGRTVPADQLVTLPEEFKGNTLWHAYTDKQIETLRLFILWIAERDSIDVRAGLIAEIKKQGPKAFEFNQDAYSGKVKGMWTHANVRAKDKEDLFPQPNLIEMLLSI
jgi:N-acetyl-anhydromuramyl-L-alanine amidase AmpD